MSKYIVYPNGSITTRGAAATIYGGSASVHAALGDASDATYVKAAAKLGLVADSEVTTPAIVAGERIVAVCAGMRLSKPSASTGRAKMYASLLVAGAVLQSASGVILNTTSSITNREAAPYAVAEASWLAPDGSEWTTAHMANLIVSLWDTNDVPSASEFLFYRSWISVFTHKPAVVSVEGPVGNITTVSQPQAEVDISTVNDDWLSSLTSGGDLEVKWFTAAQYGAPGFDPETATPFASGTARYDNPNYVDGVTPGTVTVFVTPDKALTNDTTFRAYARASRDVFSGQSAFWGVWDYSEFTMDLTPSATPTLTATAVTATGTIDVEVSAAATAGHSAPAFEIERTEDGVTWSALRGCTALSATFDDTYTIHDREMSRGVETTYRARVVTTLAGGRVASEWSATDAATLAVDGWWLRMPQLAETPAVEIAHMHISGMPASQRNEDVGIFRVKGFDLPVIVGGDFSGWDGSYSVFCDSASAFDALVALLDRRGPVWVESPFGDSKWVRFTTSAEAVKRGSTLASVRRAVELSYVECEAAVGETIIVDVT